VSPLPAEMGLGDASGGHFHAGWEQIWEHLRTNNGTSQVTRLRNDSTAAGPCLISTADECADQGKTGIAQRVVIGCWIANGKDVRRRGAIAGPSA
jgi:hypothetical protein